MRHNLKSIQPEELRPLFDYLDQEFIEIKKDIKELKTGQEGLRTGLVNLAEQDKNNHEEMRIINHRVERNEKWMRQVIEKLGIPVHF